MTCTQVNLLSFFHLPIFTADLSESTSDSDWINAYRKKFDAKKSLSEVEELISQNKRIAERIDQARVNSSRVSSSISDQRVRKRKGKDAEEPQDENLDLDFLDEATTKEPDSVSFMGLFRWKIFALKKTYDRQS